MIQSLDGYIGKKKETVKENLSQPNFPRNRRLKEGEEELIPKGGPLPPFGIVDEQRRVYFTGFILPWSMVPCPVEPWSIAPCPFVPWSMVPWFMPGIIPPSAVA